MRPTLRDYELIDAIEVMSVDKFTGDVYRLVRDGRDPTSCWHPKGRWDDGQMDVLYTSLSEDGALAEVKYHQSQQPFAPDFLAFRMYRLPITNLEVLDLRSKQTLTDLGVDLGTWGRSNYVSLSNEYVRTQEIAAVAEFHERSGLLVPSARSAEFNLVVLTAQALESSCGEPEDLGLREII